MCNDIDRMFFRSNKHWNEGIESLTLIYNIISWKEGQSSVELEGGRNRKIVDMLLVQHVASIVQWGFWEEQYRPDITGELTVKACKQIVSMGKQITKRLIEDAVNRECKRRLENIAITPIISKAYDSSCLILYMAMLIRQLPITRGVIVSQYICLEKLIAADCVDKGTLTEIIGLGFGARRYSIADFVLKRLTIMLQVETAVANFSKRHPSDTRVAFAMVGLLRCASI